MASYLQAVPNTSGREHREVLRDEPRGARPGQPRPAGSHILD